MSDILIQIAVYTEPKKTWEDWLLIFYQLDLEPADMSGYYEPECVILRSSTDVVTKPPQVEHLKSIRNN